VKLIIDLSDDNKITAVGDGKLVIICESVKRMTKQLVILSEVYSGEEVDSIYFADVTYLDNE
jgi:hypothetical protein